MAGMLYLPRLFVYHCGAEPGSKQSEDFKTMERKLLRGIINPSMIIAFILGIILLWHLDHVTWVEGWLHAKLTLAAFLLVYHLFLSRWRRDFASDTNVRSAKFYRWERSSSSSHVWDCCFGSCKALLDFKMFRCERPGTTF